MRSLLQFFQLKFQAFAGTNHAIVQSLLRTSAFLKKLPAPCCVPSSLDSLTILTVEEGNYITLRTLPHMVVKSCSCQWNEVKFRRLRYYFPKIKGKEWPKLGFRISTHTLPWVFSIALVKVGLHTTT